MLSFRSIRSRLTVTFLLIIVTVMLIVGIFLDQLLGRYHVKSLQESLVRSGELAGQLVAAHLQEEADPVWLSTLAQDFKRQSNAARVIFVDQKGVVLGDSVRVGGYLGQRLVREEVDEALAGEIGASLQLSERTGQKVMQVAIPIVHSHEVVGVVFLSASLQEIDKIMTDTRRFLFLSTLLAAAVTGAGSIFLARRFTGPLELLEEAAGSMAEGKLDQQIEVISSDEIGRLARRFNHMAEQLNYHTKNLHKFVADVAHELRTPLASLSLIIKSLKDYQMEPEQQQEFIEDLDHEMDRLIALVKDLLELSALEGRALRLEYFDLAEMVRDLCDRIAPNFDRQGIRLLSELPPGEVMVSGSWLQLRQALHNLLDNALGFTPAGGWVKVSLWVEEGTAGLKVEDTGGGIPEKDLPFIFQRFYRVDQARSRESGGTGLGLAIVKETVEAHGGTVGVESEAGLGSTFYFTLPLEQEGVNNN